MGRLRRLIGSLYTIFNPWDRILTPWIGLYRFIGVSRHLVGVSRHLEAFPDTFYAFPDTFLRFQTLVCVSRHFMGQGPWAGPGPGP